MINIISYLQKLINWFMKQDRKYKLTVLVTSIEVILLSWIALSYIEVITHNMPSEVAYTYNDLNFFEILLNAREKYIQ